MADVGDVYG